MKTESKIGIFLCECGGKISNRIDLPQVGAKLDPAVAPLEHGEGVSLRDLGPLLDDLAPGQNGGGHAWSLIRMTPAVNARVRENGAWGLTRHDGMLV